MSRRFGRRQKKKMLKVIADLESDVKASAQYQQYACKLEMDIQEWSERIKRYLGVYSSFGQMPEVVTNGHMARVALTERQVSYISQNTMADSIGVEFMHRFCVIVDDMPEEANRLIKLFELDSSRNRAYYSISDHEFYKYGLPDDFIRWVSREVAEKLTSLLNQNPDQVET